MDPYSHIEDFLKKTYPFLELISCEKNGEIIYFHCGVPFVKFGFSLGQIIVEELFVKSGADITIVK